MLFPDLDEDVIEALRQRAAAIGLSVEEETGRALAASVALARLDVVRARIGRLDGPSSVDFLRRDRDRDNIE